ncbi:iron-containing alcohol dehydrogenase [Sporosarcina saromensis]|uniref:Iron-containing alcohol dehydrogenase n=1 Tax=Sporosarcina saromensis TaxID=359365 RepID=A0ABU4G7Z5_9BACL|nr:iron-containing alcohol dehydrogenase [Sporosarcina saromensis]MDW0113091.1 iron-containing alcohol dehydrogenase [Sporosarcina saromensis]
MYKLYCRSFQQVMKVSAAFLPWRVPELITGENSVADLPGLIAKRGIDTVLIITDQGIIATGLMEGLLEGLQREKIRYAIYDRTVPNPTIDQIEEALQLYHESGASGIIAFGGGSPIDCAKGVGARVARPTKSIPNMKGILKVRGQMPPLFAVPTTSGTGSEATLACVVSNSKTHEKYAMMDPVLIPHVAVLDPVLTVNLPKHITATTGMDALTHAVEAYIGKSATKQTRQWSIEAVKLIYENLYEAYLNGDNLRARDNMQKAAYLAGMAFTRAYVGNIHAIAHTLSGFYNVPHGLANAVIMPHVLEHYGKAIHEPLANLADAAGVSNAFDTTEQKAVAFIQSIKTLNEKMAIPSTIDCIVERDIPMMVKRALQEANPLYPVPKIFGKKDMEGIIRRIVR